MNQLGDSAVETFLHTPDSSQDQALKIAPTNTRMLCPHASCIPILLLSEGGIPGGTLRTAMPKIPDYRPNSRRLPEDFLDPSRYHWGDICSPLRRSKRPI